MTLRTTYSMTAYAQAATQTELGELSCELRTVNHRFLEVAPRMPDELRPFEGDLREAIGVKLSRGRVDCFIRLDTQEMASLALNEDLLNELNLLMMKTQAAMPTVQPLRAIDALRWPGVLQSKSADPAELKKNLLSVVNDALDALLTARSREGEKMAELIHQRLEGIKEVIADVEKALPEIVQIHKQRLQDKLAEYSEQLDPHRVEQEMIILLNKADVAEELDRLNVHLGEVASVLSKSAPAGRKLDFLMQELNREANTLGSKSNDARVTKASVDMKVLIEQMREQVQNLE